HWIIDRFALKSSERIGADGKALPIDPAGYVEDWGRLIEKAIDRSYPLCDGSGRMMRVRLTVCDSGGEDGVSNRAYEFHRKLRREGKDGRFRLIKGRDTGPRMMADQYPDTRGRKDRDSGSAGDVPVCYANVNELKDTLAADLERETPGPGYW
ncbi:terminase, partial [Staphylococcus pseudintermedius]|uniref:terminase gpA endonuclease subunit n=1 Tax=Staphylococcus pseudintermedius TaxID=283734 RepID=UPI0010CE5632